MKSFKQIFKNNSSESGFSLVQVMIAFGLVGALSLVIMKMMDNSRKAQKYIEVKNNESQTFAQISSYLTNKNICNAAFTGFRAGESFEILQFNTKGTGTKLEKGTEIGNSGLLVEELQILPDPVQINGNLYELTFRIRTKRKDGNYTMAGTTKNKDFKFIGRLCEPWLYPYRDSVEYSLAKNKCNDDATKPGIDSKTQVPEDGKESMQGIFECHLCGKSKAIAGCNE